jgi:DNA invertase Pin-like site-specific DNA recombinase
VKSHVVGPQWRPPCSLGKPENPAQHFALKAAGAERAFAEKVSGAKTDRRQLQRAIGALNRGDLLLVTRLDRLARSTRDLLNVLATISASIRSQMPGRTQPPLTEGSC